MKVASCKSALNAPPPSSHPPVVYSTDRSKALVPVLVLLFVALWFILRGDLLYVFPCVILFLYFSVLLVLRLPCLGKRELILVLFVRLFGLCLFRFVGFLFLLGSGKGCGLWLWHSVDFSLTLFLQMPWKAKLLLWSVYIDTLSYLDVRSYLMPQCCCFSICMCWKEMLTITLSGWHKYLVLVSLIISGAQCKHWNLLLDD